jgi:hypothetical protein
MMALLLTLLVIFSALSTMEFFLIVRRKVKSDSVIKYYIAITIFLYILSLYYYYSG